MADRETTRELGGAKPTTAVAERARRAAANFMVERVWRWDCVFPLLVQERLRSRDDERGEAMDGGGKSGYTWHCPVVKDFENEFWIKGGKVENWRKWLLPFPSLSEKDRQENGRTLAGCLWWLLYLPLFPAVYCELSHDDCNLLKNLIYIWPLLEWTQKSTPSPSLPAEPWCRCALEGLAEQ